MICVPLPRKHISLVICVPLPGKHISLVICVPLPWKHISLVICVSLPGKPVSLMICVPSPGKHISLLLCVPPQGKQISLVICVPQPGKHVLLVIRVPLPRKHIINCIIFNILSPNMTAESRACKGRILINTNGVETRMHNKCLGLYVNLTKNKLPLNISRCDPRGTSATCAAKFARSSTVGPPSSFMSSSTGYFLGPRTPP